MTIAFIGGGDPQDHLKAATPQAAPKEDDMRGAFIRGGNIIGDPHQINPLGYETMNYDNNVDTPLDKRQPQFVGIAQATWQSILVNVLPYARIHGMPGPSEVAPGMAGPLNDEERAALQALLDAEAT